MKFLILAAATIALSAAQCMWPNGTDSQLHWWQCSPGSMTILKSTPLDTNNNYEYPIHLGRPLIMEVEVNNPRNTYSNGNLVSNMQVWEWSRTKCTWVVVPTFGLLSDQNPCANGLPCPIRPGIQNLPVRIDFSPYKTIVELLHDNTPYQLTYTMHDKASGDTMCATFQARAMIN